jgi:hypothetical protein
MMASPHTRRDHYMNVTVHGILPLLRTVSTIISSKFHLVESPPANFLNAVFPGEVDWAKFTGGLQEAAKSF